MYRIGPGIEKLTNKTEKKVNKTKTKPKKPKSKCHRQTHTRGNIAHDRDGKRDE